VTVPVGMTWAGGIELTVGWIPIAAAAATALVGLAVGTGRAVRVSRADRADEQVTTFRCSEDLLLLPVNQRLEKTPKSRGGDELQCCWFRTQLHP
jgi:hypothetical protein